MTTHSINKSIYEALHITWSRYLNLLFERLEKKMYRKLLNKVEEFIP